MTSCARATGVMSHMRTRRHLFGYYGVESTETIPYPSTKQNNVLMAVLQPKNAIGNAIAHGHGNHNLLNSNITTKRIGGVPLLTQRTLDRLRPPLPRGNLTTSIRREFFHYIRYVIFFIGDREERVCEAFSLMFYLFSLASPYCYLRDKCFLYLLPHLLKKSH